MDLVTAVRYLRQKAKLAYQPFEREAATTVLQELDRAHSEITELGDKVVALTRELESYRQVPGRPDGRNWCPVCHEYYLECDGCGQAMVTEQELLEQAGAA